MTSEYICTVENYSKKLNKGGIVLYTFIKKLVHVKTA